MSDHELLQLYTRDRSQSAFATLVEHHINLVYSAARRQVRSPHLAEEIVQSVFIELARGAPSLPPTQPLAAWLYVVTRRTALNALRHESRRLARETTAAELAAMQTPSESWLKVEAALDEAMETLNDTERTAIILRFFQNLSLREVGESLGLSEDTAQKRVSRAVDQLRTFFLRRGIAVSAAGLATDLSAHALQMAPAGLGPAISTVATAGTIGAAVTLETSRVIAMTTMQKSIAFAAFAVVAGTGLYETVLAARQSADLATLSTQSKRTAEEIGALHGSRAAAAAQLKSVELEIDRRLAAAIPPPAAPVSAADNDLESQMKIWLAQIDRLKQLLVERPEWNIPELQLLTEQEWFDVASTGRYESEEDLRRATSQLRHRAENTVAAKISNALKAYVQAHDGTLPSSPLDLAPFFDPPIAKASTILGRYEMLQTGNVSEVPSNQLMHLMTAKAPADPEIDAHWFIGTTGFGNRGSAMSENVQYAQKQFAKTNNGRRATTADELLSYLKWPVNAAALQKVLEPSPRPATP